jgi:hypothetical protein
VDEHSFEHRVGRNEARLRAVNEGIDRGRVATDRETLIAFVCECGSLDCRRLLQVTPAEYEAVRADPRRFLIIAGHEIAEAEVVVATRERYTVVEKRGVAGAVAKRTDPRG